MAQATYSIANFNQASYFKSWTGKDGDGTVYRGYTTPSSNTQTYSVVISGLPAITYMLFTHKAVKYYGK